MPLDQVHEAIQEIQRGRPVIVVDDEDRENEGDIVIAAEKITPEWVNFMAKHGRGLICLTRDRRSARRSSTCRRWSERTRPSSRPPSRSRSRPVRA